MSSKENQEVRLYQKGHPECALSWEDGIRKENGWRVKNLERHCFRHPRVKWGQGWKEEWQPKVPHSP